MNGNVNGNIDLDGATFLDDEWSLSDDADSAVSLDEVDHNSTRSLSSSIIDYQYINGRRYNAFRYGQYYKPNDERQQECMDLFHHVCSLLLDGRTHCAPVENPLNILDIGTGTGIWAIDIADKFPMARVIGTDLSPIQPSWLPPNLQIHIDDCESEWTFSQRFDYIHARNLAGSIADWPGLLNRVFQHLTPGGWIEIGDIDFPSSMNGLPSDSPSMAFNTLVRQTTANIGRPLDVNNLKERMLRDAGFVNISKVVRMAPISRWKRGGRFHRIATYHQYLVMNEIEGTCMLLFTQELNWTNEQIQVYLAAVRDDYAKREYKMYQNMVWVYAQKPTLSRSVSA